jgi:hypothetical protein
MVIDEIDKPDAPMLIALARRAKQDLEDLLDVFVSECLLLLKDARDTHRDLVDQTRRHAS